MTQIYKIRFCAPGWCELPFFLCCDRCLKYDKTFCIISHIYGHSNISETLVSLALNEYINQNNSCVEMLGNYLFVYRLLTPLYILHIKKIRE